MIDKKPHFIFSQTGGLYRKMLRECDKIFRNLGFPLEMDQLPVLMIIHYDNGIAQQEICAKLQRDKASVNRTIAFLTKAGITEVVPYGDSKRKTIVQLTETGKKLAVQADDILDKFGNDISASLTTEEKEQFNVIMQKLIDQAASI